MTLLIAALLGIIEPWDFEAKAAAKAQAAIVAPPQPPPLQYQPVYYPQFQIGNCYGGS